MIKMERRVPEERLPIWGTYVEYKSQQLILLLLGVYAHRRVCEYDNITPDYGKSVRDICIEFWWEILEIAHLLCWGNLVITSWVQRRMIRAVKSSSIELELKLIPD